MLSIAGFEPMRRMHPGGTSGMDSGNGTEFASTLGMSLIGLIVVLIVVGVALYLIGLIPMDAKVLMAIRAIVILLVIVWILSLFFDFGLSAPVGHIHVPTSRCP